MRSQAQAGVDVTHYKYDLSHSGLNSQETTLTPANVSSATFGLLRVLPGDGRVFAEPLYLSNLKVAGSLHNVVFVATEHNSVYAYDANTGTKLWQTTLTLSGTGGPALTGLADPAGMFNQEVGRLLGACSLGQHDFERVGTQQPQNQPARTGAGPQDDSQIACTQVEVAPRKQVVVSWRRQHNIRAGRPVRHPKWVASVHRVRRIFR